MYLMRGVFLFILIVCGISSWCQDTPVIVEPDDTTSRPVRRTSPPRQFATRRVDTTVRDSAMVVDSSLAFAKDYRPTISKFQLKLDSPLYANHPFFQFTHPMRYSITKKKMAREGINFLLHNCLITFFRLNQKRVQALSVRPFQNVFSNDD